MSASRGLRPPVLAALLAAVLLAGLTVMGARNLDYRGMWWDEAAQFWISQGLSNYSPPFAARQGLFEVAVRNAWENLDPGGLSVLLHGWTLWSRGIAWLRLLPFMFFLAAASALALLGWRLTRSGLFAVGAGAAYALYPAALYYGLEIRAYGMEMAGVVVGALLLVATVEKPSSGRAALLGLACALFLTSRYSFVLTVAALLIALALAASRRLAHAVLWRRLAVAVLPPATVGAAIAALMLSHQLWPEMRGGELGVAPPVYTRGVVLRYTPTPLALVVRNVVSPAALPITLAVVVLALHLWRGARRAVPRVPAATAAARSALLEFVAALQLMSVAVSLAGLYPWDIAGRWSAYLVSLSAVAAVTLAAEARAGVLARVAARADAARSERRMRRMGTALAALVVAGAAVGAARHRQSVEGAHRTSVALQIDLLPADAFAPHRVFVAHFEVPMLRYLYEYGPYAGRPEYPWSFRFETTTEWRAKAPISSRREDIRYIISALALAEARARFPGASLERYGPDGSRLLAVSAPPEQTSTHE